MDKLAICGNEKEYVKRLSESFRSILKNEMEILLFTDSGAFSEYLKENRVKICLALEDFKIGEKDGIGNLLWLSDEEGSDKVYKYMSCEKIYSEVMARCAERQECIKTSVSASEKEVIGIYTPVKRSFQTTFSITLGQILSKKKKVLYLNFECFSGFDSLLGKIGTMDLMDLLYFSECEDSNFSYRVDSLKERIGNLDYISPVNAFFKFSQVTKAQWERLIDTILKKTDYEVLILDLSENVNGLLDILKKCSLVYTITDTDRVATAKVAQYENLLRESSYREILTKTENIRIPKLREIPGNFELLPHSEFADFVKRMINFDTDGEIDDRRIG
ncbi:MAG: hypothetical protein J5626_07625 [Lachnospiraceae bacterium]|nr:hypothetical protein [Lachnospiraceae bacterium]